MMKAGDQLTITLIAVDVPLDDLMHAADMFEPWKRLIVKPLTFSGHLEEGHTLEDVIPTVVKTINEAPGKLFKVIAAFHPYISEGAWCEREIIMISDGLHFSKFADFLLNHAYRGPLPKRYLDEKLDAHTTPSATVPEPTPSA
jgi:hypothetical protein